MRKKVIRIAAWLLVLALLPALALADRFAVVRGGRLNLRAYPSADSRSLGKYDTGTWVIAGSPQNGWCPVSTLSGKTGYMSANYLNFGAYNGGATVKYANGGYVNLRSGPSLYDGVVTRVPSGSVVSIQGLYGEWYYLQVNVLGQTAYGYMHESFLDTGMTTSVVTTRNGGDVNVRSGPNSKYGSIGQLASGTQVNVLLKGNGWYMISANGLEGFMSTQYLSGSGSTIGSNTGSTTTSMTAWVNNPKSTQVLNLRETASQSARSIGQYRNGTRVKVVSKGATWCEVYVGTRHGYMMTRYLSFDGNYVAPNYPSYPSYPSYPGYPGYPTVTQTPVYIYPTATPTPVYVYPTSTPLVQYYTPVPQQPSAPEDPKSGDTITLAIAAGGSSNMINVYNDAQMTSYKASYPHGTQAMMLKYGTNSCMIYIGGGVAHVSTWNVNY
ncbi:MAG: SH3 domain-containing protein [Clostridia bacterium]|nr:SH3 domain-containing protein [Clostridia bacterium]